MIFELAQDFHDAAAAMSREHPKRRILELLEEAIRRDIHFIARHPTTLFQCMWNMCWWYDCPDAAKHYESPAAGWATSPPWERPGPKLSVLLEKWHTAKEDTGLGLPWLHNLHPPGMHLGSWCKGTLEGHEQSFTAIAVSVDGTYIASAASYESLRIWDASTGRELHCLQGHDGGIKRVAFSSASTLVASCTGGMTVQIWELPSGTALRRFCCTKPVLFARLMDSDRRIAVDYWEEGKQGTLVWDIETGSCEVPANDGGSRRPSRRLLRFEPVSNAEEGVIEMVRTREMVAFWPVNPRENFAPHPNGDTWAISGRRGFALVRLEGMASFVQSTAGSSG